MSPTIILERSQQLVCDECGHEFFLSARWARDVRKGRRPAVCRECRFPVRVTEEALAKARRWWIEESGLTLDEIQALARMVWPEDIPRPVLTLVAEDPPGGHRIASAASAPLAAAAQT